MEGMLLGILPLAAGIVALALGADVLVRNPGLPVSRAFFSSMLFAGIFSLILFALLLMPDRSSAVMLPKALLFTAVLSSGANTFLAASLSIRRGASWTKDHAAFSLFAVVLIASSAGLMGDLGAALPQDAYSGLTVGSGFAILLCSAMTGLSIGAIHFARKVSTDQYFRRASVWLGAAFALPIVSVASVFGSDGSLVFGVAASSAPLLSTAAFTYVAVRYRTFTQVPAVKAASPSPGDELLSPGCSMLVEGKSTVTAYSIFLSELRRGGDGLIISRTHPAQVRDAISPENASILWLCTQPGAGRIDPSSLSLLQATMADFLKKDKRSVLMLDGLEYLVSQNRPDKILRIIYSVKDVVTMSGSKLIVPLDPETLDERDLAFFEREFKVLRPRPEQTKASNGTAS